MRCLLLLCPCLILFVSATGKLAQAEELKPSLPAKTPARLAVIGSREGSDLAAVLVTALSENKDLLLVEREDMARVGNELKLQQMANADAPALGKLVHAEGLLFIDKEANQLRVRFTAVGLGYALFDDLMDPPADLPQLAKTIAHRVAGYVPKLRLDPAKAIPISVLNFRNDLNPQGTSRLERELTLLLESRLAAIPEYVVLERRHSSPLPFERSLSSPSGPSLIKGTYLVDGSLEISTPNRDEIIASLRIRSGETGQSSTVQVQGSTTDLHAFAEALTKKISTQIGNPISVVSWTPQKEAREFFQEGIWGWQHNSPLLALEALDSAEMLGESSTDFRAIRVHVLCQVAEGNPDPRGNGSPQIMPPPLPERVDLLHRALADLQSYQNQAGESKLEIFSVKRDPPVRYGEVKGHIMGMGFTLLKELDTAGDPSAATVRKDLRLLCDYDPRQNNAPSLAIAQASALAESLEEEKMYLKIRSSGSSKWLPSELNPGTFAPRFFKTPEEQKAGYDRFVQELINDPLGKCYGLFLSMRQAEPREKDRIYPLFIAELTSRQKELMASQHLYTYAYMAERLPQDLRDRHAGLTIPMLRYYLQNSDSLSGQFNEYIFKFLWHPQTFPPSESTAIWADFQEGKKRDPQKDPERARRNWLEYESAYLAVFPKPGDPASPDRKEERLTVDRYWYPSPPEGQPPTDFFNYDMIPSKDGVWVIGHFNGNKIPDGIHQIRLPDLETNFLQIESDNQPYGMVIAGEKLYVLCGDEKAGGAHSLLKRYDRETQSWTTKKITRINSEGLYAVNDQLYLNLWGAEEGGLGRYDWETDKLTILASSRRRPALNQFDDRAEYQLHGVFAGPGNKVYANPDGKVVQVLDQTGNWPAAYDLSRHVQVTAQGRKTLVMSAGGEVVLLDADQSAPIPLMAPAQATDWREMTDKTLKKALPSWADKAAWKVPSFLEGSGLFHYPGNLAYHDGHLILLSAPNWERNYFEMLWFTKGSPDPAIIPLRFLINSSEEESAKGFAFPPKPEKPNSNSLRMLVTKNGICFHEVRGFWYLPFADIESFLRSASE